MIRKVGKFPYYRYLWYNWKIEDFKKTVVPDLTQHETDLTPTARTLTESGGNVKQNVRSAILVQGL